MSMICASRSEAQTPFRGHGDSRGHPVEGGTLVNKKKGELKARLFSYMSASTEIRTPVLTLKGSRPGPLDDGGNNERDFTK